ncbi:GNAT family N-acetyltransferase [Porphyrobacter algicida]|uniref:GNAT family N-acetyltransferase n=1 Tax=Qipengyuania algicida TaxID=1836209 RepID=A0A845AC27_9SPHN|nr:GNAT family N-acetyltransferase [Qipengyuania algicida]
MSETVLETGRLMLRSIGPNDAEEQFRVLNTPMVMARLGGPKTLEQIREKHAKAMAMYAAEGFSFLFLIEKDSGEMVGHAGIKRVDNPLASNPGDHEIGWLIREDRWRMGYAAEAVRAIIGWAFGPVGAPHVVALTSELNVPSWKLMEKLGMERRRDLDFEDPAYPPEDRTTILYSLTREQWETAA